MTTLDSAGAAALVVSGLSGKPLAALVAAAEQTGLPVIDVPLEHIATFTTEVLSAILEHQTAILRRLEDADRALVQIVLAGGSLDDLCEQVVGFLDGAAMVTTTDGRVLARAGSPRRARARAVASTASTAPAGCSPRPSRWARAPTARRRTAPPCASSPDTSTTASSSPSAATGT